MNWISNKNILNINNKEIKFKYDIGIVKECDNNIIVMLEYKKELPKEITDVLGSDNKTIVNTIVLDIIKNSLNK